MLDHLDEHAAAIVTDLSALIQVPSISGTDVENSVQDDLARRLTQIGTEVDHWSIPLAETIGAHNFPGAEVDRSEAYGLVGRLAGRGDGPSLMLNGHVDVVPPGDLAAWPRNDPFDGAADAERVYGRGACDMKGGLVASIWAVQALRAVGVPLRGDLLLACVVGEEDGGLGTYATLQRGWRADACVIPEPTSLDLVPANGGALTFRLHVPGLASHASRRSAGVSAVEKFWPVFQALRALEAARNVDADPMMARWDIPYPIEIGQVHAGEWSSSVPDLLVAEGRYGVRLGESTAEARVILEDTIAQTCREDPWLADHPVRVQWWGGQFASSRTDDASPILDAVARAHAGVSTHRQQRWGAPYGSDLRLMNTIGGVPTVHYGPGDVTLAHGPGESVPIAEVLTTARALAALAIDYCGVS
ncbi:acetylornithine deacetylase [Nakamurella sp. UYEF19]|uniref:ArgE/DapE family deacylase n=1 Tax=Nakamurella sp. UYEF19 TaxID=1756392 RepID=UPI0033976A56